MQIDDHWTDNGDGTIIRSVAIIGVATASGTFMENMTFGLAIEAMRNGHKVARKGWNGRNMWIVLMDNLQLPPNSSKSVPRVNDRTAKYIGADTPLDSQPYFAMMTSQKKWQPGWLASQADMLNSDWFVVS